MVRPFASGGWRFSCPPFGVGPPSLCCAPWSDGWLCIARSPRRSQGAGEGYGLFAELHKQALVDGHGDHRGHQAALQEEVFQRSGVDHGCCKHPAGPGEGAQDGGRHGRVGGGPRGPRARRRRASGRCMGHLEGRYRQVSDESRNASGGTPG